MASVINASNTAGLIVTPDNSGVLQFQANSVPSISIDVYGRPVLPVTGLPPVITPGAFEYANNVMYFTPAGTQRGLVPSFQYYRLDANNTLTNTLGVQNIFNVGATISSGVIYNFEAVYLLNRTSGTTSHSMALLFGGTATFNNFGYGYHRYSSPSGFNQDVGDQTGYVTSNTSFTLTALRSVPYGDSIQIKGTFSCNTGGTFIPQLSYSAAPGGTTAVVSGSYILLNPVGSSNSNTSIGTWA